MSGLYVHIPLCKQRCIYCDFYSTSFHGLIDDYIDCVIAEAKLRPASEITTVYVGGGTPSQLSPQQFTRLVSGLNDVYDLTHVEEFTVEVNPDDVTIPYVVMLRSLGVNRISMGVQSFVDEELTMINRRHDAQGAHQAIECIKAAGINNISLDLIYGIPGQSLDSWRHSISCILNARVNHISAYNLSCEPGTRLWLMREQAVIEEVDEQTCVDMYNLLTSMLRDAGYEHYEISNFSLPGYHSRHNSSYWNRTPYVGLGASAHSFDGTHRGYNPASIQDYIKTIGQGRVALCTEHLEWNERYDEWVMVALRTSRGLDCEEIKTEFGDEVYEYLLRNAQQYIASRMIVKEGSRIYIPEDALMMSDAIIRDLMWEV